MRFIREHAITTRMEAYCQSQPARIVASLCCAGPMANQVVQLFEALLQSIAALDEDPCGLEGLAAAARQQQEQCHKFNQLLKQFKQTRILQQRNWKKLISDHKVGICYMTNVFDSSMISLQATVVPQGCRPELSVACTC